MQGRTVYAVLGDWIGWICVLIAILGIGRGYQIKKNRLAKSGAERNIVGKDHLGKRAHERMKGQRHRHKA